MTELIGTHEIPCLSDTDYAAYALYMRCVAEKVEEQLVANQVAAESALHRAIRVWHFTDNVSQGGAALINADGALFSLNYPADFADNVLATLNLRGWWRIGLLFRCVSSAPVVGNNRLISFAIFPTNTPAGLRNMESEAWALRLQDVTWESNTGAGESLHTSGEVYNPGYPTVGADQIGMRMVVALSVENSGAETVTFTGTVWAAYLGDTPSIKI